MAFEGLSPSTSITANSNRRWLRRHQLRIRRYLRQFHKKEDWDTITNLLFWFFPDEGRKLIENFDLLDSQKLKIFLDYFIFSPQITWLMFADERMGKDSGVCFLLEVARERYFSIFHKYPRIVTLGNIKIPPFVDPKDRYWSFKDIPSGSARQEVWVYCSELETVLPARDGLAPENKLFSMISGTFAQNHIKLIGCVKLASKVDLNAIRGCNIKSFKYINPEKLKIDKVERANILSELGSWLLPKDRQDKEETLLAFDNQLFTLKLPLPTWWTDDYSEQFREVSDADIWTYLEATCDFDIKPSAVMTIIAQKFRNKTISREQITEFLKKNNVLSRGSVR